MNKKKFIVLGVFVLLIGLLFLVYIAIKNNRDNNIELQYEVLEKTNIQGTLDEQKRGHELIKKDNDYYLIIYYGPVNHVASLDEPKVTVTNDKIEVTVKVKESSDNFVLWAFSYPKTVLKLNKKPRDISIIYE